MSPPYTHSARAGARQGKDVLRIGRDSSTVLGTLVSPHRTCKERFKSLARPCTLVHLADRGGSPPPCRSSGNNTRRRSPGCSVCRSLPFASLVCHTAPRRLATDFVPNALQAGYEEVVADAALQTGVTPALQHSQVSPFCFTVPENSAGRASGKHKNDSSRHRT